MKIALATAVLVLILVPAIADAGKPILNIVDVSIPVKPSGTAYTAQEVQESIEAGCRQYGWSPVLDEAGIIHATIEVRARHFAHIKIPFTPERYSILYVASSNLDYDEKRQTIHRNYNKWITNLSNAINSALRTNSWNTTPTPVTSQPEAVTGKDQDEVFEELLKLDELRKQGILTQEEFDAEKRKLLNLD